MEAMKNAIAVIASLVGVLTAILTLYAKFLDVKKEVSRERKADDAAKAESARPEPAPGFILASEPVEPAPRNLPPTDDFATIERARLAVRAPAITLIATGLISLFANLFIAGFGYVDRFVTPLTDETRQQHAFMETAGIANAGFAPGMTGSANVSPDSANAVLTIFTLLSLSVASAAAVWAGYGMLRLRSYWLSVAGSFAIMAGAGFCCMAGIPVGVWSLVILFRPEVASSFR